MKLKNAMILLTCIFLLSACNQEKPTMKVLKPPEKGIYLQKYRILKRQNQPQLFLLIGIHQSKP